MKEKGILSSFLGGASKPHCSEGRNVYLTTINKSHTLFYIFWYWKVKILWKNCLCNVVTHCVPNSGLKTIHCAYTIFFFANINTVYTILSNKYTNEHVYGICLFCKIEKCWICLCSSIQHFVTGEWNQMHWNLVSIGWYCYTPTCLPFI